MRRLLCGTGNVITRRILRVPWFSPSQCSASLREYTDSHPWEEETCSLLPHQQFPDDIGPSYPFDGLEDLWNIQDCCEEDSAILAKRLNRELIAAIISGDVQRVATMRKELRKKKVDVHEPAYNEMLLLFAAQHDLRAVKQVLAEMQPKMPNVFSYNALVHCFAAALRPEEVTRLRSQYSHHAGYTWSERTYNRVYTMYMQLRDLKAATEIRLEAESLSFGLDKPSYSMLLRHHAAVKDVVSVEATLEEMAPRGVSVDVAACGDLIAMYAAKADRDAVVSVQRRLRSEGKFKLEAGCLNYVSAFLASRGDLERVKSMRVTLVSLGFETPEQPSQRARDVCLNLAAAAKLPTLMVAHARAQWCAPTKRDVKKRNKNPIESDLNFDGASAELLRTQRITLGGSSPYRAQPVRSWL